MVPVPGDSPPPFSPTSLPHLSPSPLSLTRPLWCGQVVPTASYTDLNKADVVVEAAFENPAVKQQIFATLDQHCHPSALLATNPSYLDIDTIANATARPGNVIGLHFFSPAHVMPLLEVVNGPRTTSDAIVAAMGLGKVLRKTTVLAKNAFGFIGNRVRAYAVVMALGKLCLLTSPPSPPTIPIPIPIPTHHPHPHPHHHC